MTDERFSLSRTLARRDFLALGVGAFVVAAVPWGRGRSCPAVRRGVPLMGTFADITVVAAGRRRAESAIDAALAALRETEALMTRFRDDSDVGRANLEAGRGAVSVQAETLRVLERALAWADATGGRFDPCLGRAVALWDVGNRREPPPADEVHALAGRRLWQALDLDVRRGVLALRAPEAAIDLGGIAKGRGVDRAVEALRAHGIRSALVNVGGDLYALGARADGTPWRVGVRDPSDPTRLTRTFELEDGAVATSGDAFRYFLYGGRRYHHLLDPATAAPRPSGRHSVTVLADSCMDADAAATAAFGADEAARDRIASAFPGSGVTILEV